MTGSIELQLGQVIGRLNEIVSRLDHADESRARMHTQIDGLVMRTTHLETEVHSIKQRTDRMQLVTDDVVTLRTKAEGAGTVGHGLLKAGIAIIGFVGWLVGIYTWLTGKPPP